MEATVAPAVEAIKTTEQMIDATLDEVEKILLRLPPRRVIPTNSVDMRTTESSTTTTANVPHLITAHSFEANPINQQSQPIVTADLPTVAARSPAVKTVNSARERHSRSTSSSFTTPMSPKAKTDTSPVAGPTRSTNRQRSNSTSSSMHTAVSSTERATTSPVDQQPICPSSAPSTRPQSFVLPQPRTSTPFRGQLTQSSSSPAAHISSMAKTARSSSEMTGVTSAFVLQGPVMVTSQENVTKAEDGLVYVNELIELRGTGATGAPDKELQPRTYSRSTPTSAKESVNAEEMVKVGDNAVSIQRSIAVNPAGPPSTKLSEFALSELRIYPHDGISAATPSNSYVAAQPVRVRSERNGSGVNIELNINVMRNNGTSTTPAKIKCDCPGFIPSKVWVNDRQVWTATADN